MTKLFLVFLHRIHNLKHFFVLLKNFVPLGTQVLCGAPGVLDAVDKNGPDHCVVIGGRVLAGGRAGVGAELHLGLGEREQLNFECGFVRV